MLGLVFTGPYLHTRHGRSCKIIRKEENQTFLAKKGVPNYVQQNYWRDIIRNTMHFNSARRVRPSPKTSSPSPAFFFESEPESESSNFFSSPSPAESESRIFSSSPSPAESESRIFLRVRVRTRRALHFKWELEKDIIRNSRDVGLIRNTFSLRCLEQFLRQESFNHFVSHAFKY